MRHGPKILGGAKRGLKVRQKQTEAWKKKGALDKYFNYWWYGLPSMRHHIEDDDSVDSQPGRVTSDSQSRSLCTGSDASRLESVVSDKEGTSSDVRLMRHVSKNTHNLDEQMILLLSQVSWVGMLGTTLDYLGQIGPPAITIQVFPRNESGMTRFFKFHCKRLPQNGEAVGHPWLLFLAWKNIIFATTARFSTLDIHWHSTQHLSSLQVLHSYLFSDQGGIWPERRY